MVKPIPARQAPPASIGHVTPAGRLVSPARTARVHSSRIPTGLPTARATATDTATGSTRPAGSRATPALASANSGMIPNATHGCRPCSSRCSGDTASRTTTDATATSTVVVSGSSASSRARSHASFNTSANVRCPIHAVAGVSSPNITPATVGWTPACRKANQMHTPISRYTPIDRIPIRLNTYTRPNAAPANTSQFHAIDSVKTNAMINTAIRSSTIASESSRIFRPKGTRDPNSARKPTTNAMSVAMGTAHPRCPGSPHWSVR